MLTFSRIGGADVAPEIRGAIVAMTLAGAGLVLASPASALLPQLRACAPPGWDAPIVPRPAPDVSDTNAVWIPAALRTDQPTWFNWASCSNSVVTGGHTDALYLDGALISFVGRAYQPPAASHEFVSINDGPVWVGGGRHTLMTHADLDGLYYDGPGSVYDDYASVSYLWPPSNAPWGAVTGWHTPPPHGVGTIGATPNCDAHALPRPANLPWCVSVGGPAAPGLLLCDDYTGPTSGLSHVLAQTLPAGDSLDVVVGGGEATAGTVYACVVRDLADDAGTYDLSSSDATGHTGGDNSLWLGVTLPAGAVAQVFRLTLTGGQVCPISLTRETGSAELAFAVFGAGPGGAHRLRDAIAYSHLQPPATAALAFTPPASGDYTVVVHRTTTLDFGTPHIYVMSTGSNAQVAAVPEAAGALALAIVTAQPASDPVRLAFALPAAGEARLAIFDALGRRVRTLVASALAAGRHEVVWDLTDDHGARAGAGVYWARLEQTGHATTQRLVLLR